MVEEARTAGVRVAAHAVTERGARLAIEGGVDSIEHGYAMSDEALELAKQKGIVLVGTEHALGPDRAALSPDGKWLAYESDETGVLEIFVSPFPDAGRNRWQISTEAGRQSFWAPDSEELFYVSDQRLMVVSVRTDPSFVAGKPEILFEWPYFQTPGRNFDITPDGNRFLMSKPLVPDDETTLPTQINVVLNWDEELKRLVPTEN